MSFLARFPTAPGATPWDAPMLADRHRHDIGTRHANVTRL